MDTDVLAHAIARAVAEVTPPLWLATVSSVGAIVLAITAVIALIYAKRQVDLARIATAEALEVRRATSRTEKGRFLFHVDRMFEGVEFREARTLFYTKRDELAEALRQENQHIPESEKLKDLPARFSKMLFDLHQANPKEYAQLMGVCGFFESLGLLCHRGYAEENEVFDLYATSIIQAGCLELHIRERQERAEVGTIYMEHFLRLLAGARDWVSARGSGEIVRRTPRARSS